ncbi:MULTISPECIES: AAA family ATPase [Rhodanobacter]|uniref:AAA family ATPase n=1 Tax=Rhodanobacter TaxID=75309 RepID=UPI000B1FBDCF|nr:MULTISPECIES: AAA family ATPase [Rhodanobacter]UJJ55023.1 AAA family ATPase [Rhodanobacter thiooxydans]
MRKPKLTDVIEHRNFRFCLDELEGIFRLCPTEAAILLVGPTNGGKSQLLAYLVSFLMNEIYQGVGPNDRALIGFSAMTTRQGRTTPKFALHELLEDVGHPFFQLEPISNEAPLYRPAIKTDETYCLRALKGAFHSRNVKAAIVDDAHYLVRTKDEEYKASLLEAMKGVITPQTTLILAGGYELAEVAMAYRTHFAERLLIVHLPRYGKSPSDINEWRRVVATMGQSPKLRLGSTHLLIDEADRLRHECHGVVGILEKRLIRAQSYADACHTPISAEVLKQTRPTALQWDTTEADIKSGEKLLGTRVELIDIPQSPNSIAPSTSAKASGAGKHTKGTWKKGARPFERKPRRAQPAVRT